MDEQPIHYAVLRDRRHWDAASPHAGLAQGEDGVLTLARLPGTADGKPIVVKTGESDGKPSGLALGDCRELYIADTGHQRIIRLDSLCNAHAILPGAGGGGSAPGQFEEPRGLLIANDSLYVADSGNARVQVYRLPSLELRAVWEGALQEPIALAADSQNRIYVLDGELNTVLRFSARGAPDEAYNAVLAGNLAGRRPFSIAIDDQDTLYVSDTLKNRVLRFDKAGKKLGEIQGTTPKHPRAMAARGDWLYVADDAGGEIWAFDCAAGVFLGALTDYRGPATALAVDETGALYVKPGLDEAYHTLQADVAYAPFGSLTAGPFDAGADTAWERVHAEIDLPDGTQAELHVFSADASAPAPQPADWVLARSPDTLVMPGRFLWLRVTLRSDDRRRTSPSLKQVQAETTAASYMNYLPAVYRREDAPTRFLERWLALFRSELGDLELALDDMPRRFDPRTTPEVDLRWLASWLAFEPPADLRGDELRSLLRRVHELYDRRGTPFGVREFVELYTGVRPAVFEAFHERHIWQLGYTSTLGFDTALATGLPDGMILPGHTLADPHYMGLRGEYYNGMDFQAHVLTRTDPNVDFDWNGNPPDPAILDDDFSARWTGQIVPQHSKKYTLRLISDDENVRLLVDGQSLQLQESKKSRMEYTGTIRLAGNKSHEIALEYHSNNGQATVRLYWSSMIQAKEIGPQSFRGEYYNGSSISEDNLVLVRTDPPINFISTPFTGFSVRWTGQILPRYSERYTFQVLASNRVRLYVDGVMIINTWNDQTQPDSGTIELEAGRWYAIELEYYRETGRGALQLHWSSRNQIKEIIPQSRLYSVRDEGATFELRENEQPMLVGQTVVGESGPLAKADFGMPLFSETAHLFTVSVPAGALPEPAQRDMLRQVIEAEKPAHTDYHLCFVEPRMRVGFQARLGIDSIVAGPPPPMDLAGATLGLDSHLGDEPADQRTSRVGKQAHLGQDTLIS